MTSCAHRLPIVAAAAFLAACGPDPVTPVVGPPAAVVLVSEVPEVRAVGDTIPLLVRVEDAEGRPVPGIVVEVGIIEGGSDRITNAAPVSNAEGIVASGWALGTSAGISRIAIQVEGVLPIFLRVERRAAPFARVVLVTPRDTLTARPGLRVDGDFWVKAVDRFGNGVGSVALAVSVSDGELRWATPQTYADGTAFVDWEAGPTPGVQFVTIKVAGLPDTTWPVVVLPMTTPKRIAVSAFGTHACRAAGPWGGAACWGSNERGRLGTGDSMPRDGVQPVSGGHDFTTIATGGYSTDNRGGTCGVTAAQQTWCWGNTALGAPPGVPLRLQFTHKFAHLELGETHACGLGAGGGLFCWGDNTLGKLGVGDLTARAAPTEVAPGTRFLDLAVGANHTCAITMLGRALCWGNGGSGRLGTGMEAPRSDPTPVASDLRFLAIAAGASHTCAVAVGGGMYCWGSNANGRVLGDGVQGGPIPAPTPVRPDLTFRDVTAGPTGTCGITTSGTAWCWGSNSAHQLADPVRTQLRAAAPMAGGHHWEELSLGPTSGCGVTTTQDVRCWGFNGDGVVGLPDRWRFADPQQVEGGHQFAEVATGFFHTCARKADGSAWCWGSNQNGMLGEQLPTRVEAPARLEGMPPLAAIAAANDAICGLDVGGTVHCLGELGSYLGISGVTLQPAAVPLPDPATALAIGWGLGCATLAAGDTWCWGAGTGSFGPAAEPARVNLPEPLVSLSVGIGFACGHGESGVAWCWNARGNPATAIPTFQPNGTVPVVAVAAMNNGYCLIGGDGVTRCSGPGGTPAPLDLATPLTQLAPGRYVACGLAADDTATCWGNNEFGQAGQGVLSASAAPAPVVGGRAWQQVAPSVGHTCALTPAGAAWCWGSAQTGELGNGVSRYFPTPVAVP